MTSLRHSKWLPVALLWGVALLNYLDRQVIFSQFPLIQHDLGATSGQLGLLSSVFLWVYGAASPFAGYLGDRWGRARVILLSLVVWSGATFITAHVRSIEMLLATRVLMGFSEAFYLPAALALINARHGPESRSLATGIHQSGLYTGTILGGAWGGWMGEHYGWRSAFGLLGVVGAIYAIVLLFLLPRTEERNRATSPPPASMIPAMRRVASAPGFGSLATAFGAVSVANWLIYTWLPLFLHERLNLSLSQAGFAATFYIQAASYAGMLAAGAFTDSLARRRPQARIWVAAGGMVLSAPFLITLSLISTYSAAVAALLLIGILRPCFDINAMPILRQIAPHDLSATGYGLLNMVGCIAGGFAAGTAGFVKSTLGLPAAYQTAALLLAAGALVLFASRRAHSLNSAGPHSLS